MNKSGSVDMAHRCLKKYPVDLDTGIGLIWVTLFRPTLCNFLQPTMLTLSMVYKGEALCDGIKILRYWNPTIFL